MSQLELAIRTLKERAPSEIHDTDSSPIDVTLELMSSSPDEATWGYYYANHKDRSVFWIDEIDCYENFYLWREVRGRTRPEQMGQSERC